MSSIVGALIIRLTHTGVYADGRPNTASVTIYDLDQDILKKNRARSVPVPAGGSVDIPMSSETLISYSHGTIAGLVKTGVIRAELILQFRDRDNYGGAAGTGQTLRVGVNNVERVGNFLRLVIPNNSIPANVDSIGYLAGELIEITGLTGSFRALNGSYNISSVAPGFGLAGAAAGSYLITVPSTGPDIPAAIHAAGVSIKLTDGRISVEFTSDGNLGGLGANIFGYIAGQTFPGTAGGGSALSIEDQGILVDPATTLINFVGAGVAATPTGPGLVDVTIPGGGSDLSIEDQGVLVDPATTLINFVGAGVTATPAGPGLVDVTIPGGGGATPTLAQVLASGNATGGSNILISTADSIIGQTDLVLAPGAGVGDNLILDGLTWPSADGAAGTALITSGTGILSFAAPTPATHAATHVRSGTDPVDGDLVDIDYVPTNYTRTLTPPTTSLEELTSHLRGIDLALAAAGGAATAVLSWGGGSIAASTATRYLSPWWDTGIAPLSPVQWRSPRTGTVRSLRVRHNTPTGNGNDVVYTLRVNGVATALTVTVASTSADGSDLVNSVAVAPGDLLDIEVTKATTIADGLLGVVAIAEMAS